MADIVIVANSRAETSPLESVINALPEAEVLNFVAEGAPHTEMAHALHWFTAKLTAARPRMVIVLGDRYETLAAALSATFLRIPLAHIHGGETTTGAFDDGFRHSMTHLTHQSGGLHFAATDKAAHRIIELTNGDQHVHLVGAPGLDGIPEGSARRDHDLVVVSFHPETMAKDFGAAALRDVLNKMSTTIASTLRYVFTGVNKDPGHEIIEDIIDAFCRASPSTRCVMPLPRAAYISLLQEAKMVVGNSSSIPIECPWIGVPSVLVGDRQKGRELSPIVHLHQPGTNWAMVQAMFYSLSAAAPVYRGGNVGQKIAEIVRGFLSA